MEVVLGQSPDPNRKMYVGSRAPPEVSPKPDGGFRVPRPLRGGSFQGSRGPLLLVTYRWPVPGSPSQAQVLGGLSPHSLPLLWFLPHVSWSVPPHNMLSLTLSPFSLLPTSIFLGKSRRFQNHPGLKIHPRMYFNATQLCTLKW